MKIQNIVLLAAVGAALITAGVFYVKTGQANERARENALRADSLEAALDTTRLLALALSDSVDVYQRRAHQYELEADSLDDALEAESAVRADLELRLRTRPVVVREVPVQVVDSTTEVVEFSEDDVAYSLFARISLDRKSQTAEGFFDVQLKPIYLHARVTCQDGPSEVRSASLNLVTPEWISAQLSGLEAAPEVCNPQLYETSSGGFLGIALPKGPVIGGLSGASVGFVADQSLEATLVGGVIGIALGWAFEQILTPFWQ